MCSIASYGRRLTEKLYCNRVISRIESSDRIISRIKLLGKYSFYVIDTIWEKKQGEGLAAAVLLPVSVRGI